MSAGQDGEGGAIRFDEDDEEDQYKRVTYDGTDAGLRAAIRKAREGE